MYSHTVNPVKPRFLIERDSQNIIFYYIFAIQKNFKCSTEYPYTVDVVNIGTLLEKKRSLFSDSSFHLDLVTVLPTRLDRVTSLKCLDPQDVYKKWTSCSPIPQNYVLSLTQKRVSKYLL
jgi:hypothetical protein